MKKMEHAQMLVVIHTHGLSKAITFGNNLGKRLGKYVRRLFKDALDYKNTWQGRVRFGDDLQ